MNKEHIKNSEKDNNTKSSAFYVFGGLSFISGVWSLVGNYYDPVFTSAGVWMLDSSIALVGIVFIIFQYRLNNLPTSSKSYSVKRNKEKMKISSTSKAQSWSSLTQ